MANTDKKEDVTETLELPAVPGLAQYSAPIQAAPLPPIPQQAPPPAAPMPPSNTIELPANSPADPWSGAAGAPYPYASAQFTNEYAPRAEAPRLEPMPVLQHTPGAPPGHDVKQYLAAMQARVPQTYAEQARSAMAAPPAPAVVVEAPRLDRAALERAMDEAKRGKQDVKR